MTFCGLVEYSMQAIIVFVVLTCQNGSGRRFVKEL